MKKRILFIGITVLLILAVFTSTSSIGSKIDASEGKYDLAIEITKIEFSHGGVNGYYKGTVKIKNLGDVSLPDDSNDARITINITTSKNNQKLFSEDKNVTFSGGLLPGENQIRTIEWGHGKNPPVIAYHLLKIDPYDEYNEEESENNNVDSARSPYRSLDDKSVTFRYIGPIFNLLTRLPIFRFLSFL